MARQLKDDDRRLWRDAMRGVKPLQRARQDTDDVPAISRQRETGASDEPSAPGRRLGGADVKSTAPHTAIDRRTLMRLKRGDLAIEARLDLHGMTQEAAHRALARFIAEAAADGVRVALVITGKGRGGEGVLRAAVPRWLSEPAMRAHVLGLTPAPPNLGGGGALCVRLRRTREKARS